MSTVLVTGAAGFIGSAFVRTLLNRGCPVISVDKLSYAADLRRLSDLPSGARHRFVEAGVEDGATMRALLEDEKPRAIVHFAAESHVDRSIDAPAPLWKTTPLARSNCWTPVWDISATV